MYRQKGASMTTIMMMLLIIAGAVTVGVRVGPLYMDNISLNQAIDSVASSNLQNMTKGEIRERLRKTFQVNGIKVNPRDMEITQNERETTINYIHEERANIFGNVDVVVTFTNYYSTAE